ncbi:MAG: hypothetical protein HYS17_05220 [Micavibrio aeruginosavorus]|uniref:Prolipoprotein diacylglyceryl transferase n=1 Tax=Micavibrio aeruginosavorus TaxID=349221 RepID=A0A7T5R425_9BACT|nr:MAG: hypothetical protein HYS17_05220 [Micavibrio aeruginosavorus]
MLPFIITGLVSALGFAVLWSYSRGRTALVTGGAWFAYALYEIGIQRICTGECNIRVDLLLIYPLLLILSLLSLFFVIRQRLRRRDEKT